MSYYVCVLFVFYHSDKYSPNLVTLEAGTDRATVSIEQATAQEGRNHFPTNENKTGYIVFSVSSIYICDQICKNWPSSHQVTRHTFHHQSIATPMN